MAQLQGYTYLNRDLQWPDFTLVNLEISAEGMLTLPKRPALAGTLDAVTALPAVGPGAPSPIPAGLAVTPDCDCTVYSSDPARHQVWQFDACVGQAAQLPCLAGPGASPTQVDTPRGLAIASAPGGMRLYIADSDNHRILVLDLATQQPIAIWGQLLPHSTPAPSAAAGGLSEPWDVAADATGNGYVVDYGNRRLQKFLPGGQVDETFWEAAQAAGMHQPARIAVLDDVVYVLDLGPAPQIAVFSTRGELHSKWPVGELTDPVALAVTEAAVYAGESGGRIAKYSHTGVQLSTYESGVVPLAALARGCGGELLVSGGGLPIARLREDAGYEHAGYFFAGPIVALSTSLGWSRLRVRVEGLTGAASLQLFTYVGKDTTPPPLVSTGDADAVANPFGTAWQAAPANQTDVFVLSTPVRDVLRQAGAAGGTAEEGALQPTYIWLGGFLHGDGAGSPQVTQMRLDFNPDSPLRQLPANYRAEPRRRVFLELLLAALANELGTAQDLLRQLPAYFDPAAAPVAWLPWLASWLDFDLRAEWPVAAIRAYIAAAMDLFAQRGTVDGMLRYLTIYAGVNARIVEPSTALFALDEGVMLGFNTVLAPAHADGAVAASTATLGQSHLIEAEEWGRPLFEDVAHTFCVEVYAAEVADPRTRAALTEIIEREKPAHTTCYLNVIEARMRVGLQARVGIDSIVGGYSPELRLDEAEPLGSTSVLANQPPRANGRLGAGVRVGVPLS